MSATTTVKITKIWAVANLKGLSYDAFESAVKQMIDDPNCSERVAFLDIGEVYHIVDLQDSHALILLHQRI